MGKYKHKNYYEVAFNNQSEVTYFTREALKEPATFHSYIEIVPSGSKAVFYKEGLIDNNYTRWLNLKKKLFKYRYTSAEWIDIHSGFGKCSNCGHEGDTFEIWYKCEHHFCPNCGKEMVNLK